MVLLYHCSSRKVFVSRFEEDEAGDNQDDVSGEIPVLQQIINKIHSSYDENIHLKNNRALATS